MTGEAATSGLWGIGDRHVGCGPGRTCVHVDWSFDPTQPTRLELRDESGCVADGVRVPAAPIEQETQSEVTWGRGADGRGAWSVGTPTPGEPNRPR